MLGAEEASFPIRYFESFGFEVVDSAEFSAEKALTLYGVNSNLKSYRLQNGKIDSHGLLRVLVWENPLGPGLGYAPPETIGNRMAVMRTEDIFRLVDIYLAARNSGEKWLPLDPIADDLFGLDSGKKDFFNRPVIVRETGVYGEFFNHVFFQRYGYHIPGYGTVEASTPLKTSEFTHHDFIIQAPGMEVMAYLATALGLKPEGEPALDGEWQKGPKRVFQMEPGDSHWYQGFVSPNNICGKLKFFIPRTQKPDLSQHQRPGELGITLHSFYTPKLSYVHQLVSLHQMNPTPISKNEFGEDCFVFKGPGGCSWQIIQKTSTQHQPVLKLEFQLVEE